MKLRVACGNEPQVLLRKLHLAFMVEAVVIVSHIGLREYEYGLWFKGSVVQEVVGVVDPN